LSVMRHRVFNYQMTGAPVWLVLMLILGLPLCRLLDVRSWKGNLSSDSLEISDPETPSPIEHDWINTPHAGALVVVAFFAVLCMGISLLIFLATLMLELLSVEISSDQTKIPMSLSAWTFALMFSAAIAASFVNYSFRNEICRGMSITRYLVVAFTALVSALDFFCSRLWPPASTTGPFDTEIYALRWAVLIVLLIFVVAPSLSCGAAKPNREGMRLK
jgi:hypothetical protein